MKRTHGGWWASVCGVVLGAAVHSQAVTLYWDTSTNSGCQGGPGIWSTVDTYWATNSSPPANAALVSWTDGYDAFFSVSGVVDVAAVSAQTVYPRPGSGTIRLQGTGPLTIGSGGIPLDFQTFRSTVPIILGADQTWSVNNSAGGVIDSPVSGPGRLTAREGSIYVNGSLTITNPASVINGLTVYNIIGPPTGFNGVFIAAGTVTNGLTLGLSGSMTNGANLTMTSYGMATSDVGDVTLASPSYLSLALSGTSTNVLSAGTLTRAGHSTLELSGPNGTSVKAFFTNGISMSNGLVAPWMISTLKEFWTYDAGSGLVASASTSIYSSGSYTQYVKVAASSTNLTGNAAVLAMNMNNNRVNLNNYTLTIGDGTYAGLLARNDFITTGGLGTLDFGTAEALIYVATAEYSTNYCRITGSNGLTKFGGGTLTLAADTAYGGPVWVNNGTLCLKPSADVTYPGVFTGPGTLVKDGSSAVTLSADNSPCIFSINGGSVTMSGSNTVNVLSVNNGSTLTLPAAGSLLNFGSSVGSAGGGLLVVSNGARFAPLGAHTMAASVTLAGNSAVWDAGGGTNYLSGIGATLTIDGGLVTNCVYGVIGQGLNSGLSNCTMLITNGGRWVGLTGLKVATTTGNANSKTFNSGVTLVGGNDQTTTLDLGGGPLSIASLTQGATAYASTGNFVRVLQGGVLTNVSTVVLGDQQSSNQLVIANGGRVYSGGNATISDSARGCLASVTGTGSLWDVRGGTVSVGIGGGAGIPLENGLVIADGGSMTNAGSLVVGRRSNTGGYCYGNFLVISNGGSLVCTGGTAYIGYPQAGNCFSSNNVIAVSGAQSLWNAGGQDIRVGAGFQGQVTSNTMLIADGAMVTNGGPITVGYNNVGISMFNVLTITNGASLYSRGTAVIGWGESSVNTNRSCSSNSVVIAGGPVGASLWDVGSSNLTVGSLNKTNCYADGNTLSILPGGSVFNVRVLTVGYGASSAGTPRGNLLNIEGGLVDMQGLVLGANTGNQATNSGGTYQFTSATPAITNNGPGSIALNGGMISFRNVGTANVKGNWAGSLTNIAFSGVNAFRLVNATNSTVADQSYVYDNNLGATNYARLDMVGGGTAYTNGSVTIGATAGWLMYSNTTAVMWDAVTNNGTLEVVNSDVTFKGNLVLGGGSALRWTTNSTMTVNGTLVLPASLAITVVNTPGPTEVIQLFSAASISGSPANWTGLPETHKLTVSPDGMSIMLRPRARGFLIIAE